LHEAKGYEVKGLPPAGHCRASWIFSDITFPSGKPNYLATVQEKINALIGEGALEQQSR